MTKDFTRISRRMSYALRHNPGDFGLSISADGWVQIADLAAVMGTRESVAISVQDVLSIVAADAKSRYAVQGTRIRANQGHSFLVDLDMTPQTPPEFLLHGTVGENLSSILDSGLLRGSRQYVHLSADEDTARAVGSRRGKPVILTVLAREASESGVDFYLSQNNVWLTKHVPSVFIRQP